MAGDGKGEPEVLACYFRSLFENTKDGIIQSGCISDRAQGTVTSFLYTAGGYGQITEAGPVRKEIGVKQWKKLDYFILASYSVNYLCKMIDVLKKYRTRVVILPYLTPIQRLLLAEQVPFGEKERKEIIQFLDAPYMYLKEKEVEHIFFLYENGRPISKEKQFLVAEYQFEPVGAEVEKLVYEMEGCEIPIVKAGYIALDQWIFYFGVYGPDMTQISQFVREELPAGQLEIESAASNINRITESFQKKFGNNPYGSIVMYHGPLHASPREKNSLLTARVFHREQGCRVERACDGTNCAMECQRSHDYDMMQYHKEKEKNIERFGTLLTGNVNLRKYFPEVAMRFWDFRDKVRTITIPNCGNEKYWNAQILQMFQGKDIRYWICPIRNDTSTRALLQIITESSFNRLTQLNYEYGFCISGYLVPVDTERDA